MKSIYLPITQRGDVYDSGRSLSSSSFSPGFSDIYQKLLDTIEKTRKTGTMGDNQNLDLSAFTEGTQPVGSALDSMFHGYHSYDQLLQLLNSYNNGAASTERTDALFSFILQLIATNNQREFDLSQLKESRIYNDPQNVLSRLTGAGVGRDKAIEILSGSGDSSAIGSGAGASAPSLSAPSGTTDISRTNLAFQGFQTVLSSLSQLMDSGLSLAQGIEQVKAMRSMNFLSNQDINAYVGANSALGIIQSMQFDGTLPSSVYDSWSNADDMYNYMLSNRSVPAISQFIESGDFKNAFGTIKGREYVNSLWKSLRSSRDDGTLADEFIRQTKFATALAAIQPELAGAEMEQIGQEIRESEQRIIESCNRVAQGEAQIQVLNNQGHWIDVQASELIRRNNAEIPLIHANREVSQEQANLLRFEQDTQQTQNKQLLLNYEYNSAGFAMLKQIRIEEINEELQKWNLLKYNPDLKAKRMATWLQNEQNAFDAAYLLHIHNNAVGDFAKRYPTIYSLSTGMSASGVGDMIRTGVSAAVPGSKAVKSLWNLVD